MTRDLVYDATAAILGQFPDETALGAFDALYDTIDAGDPVSAAAAGVDAEEYAVRYRHRQFRDAGLFRTEGRGRGATHSVPDVGHATHDALQAYRGALGEEDGPAAVAETLYALRDADRIRTFERLPETDSVQAVAEELDTGYQRIANRAADLQEAGLVENAGSRRNPEYRPTDRYGPARDVVEAVRDAVRADEELAGVQALARELLPEDHIETMEQRKDDERVVDGSVGRPEPDRYGYDGGVGDGFGDA